MDNKTKQPPQESITDILKSKSRTLSAEIIPPRNGTEIEKVFNQIRNLQAVPVDFISVTRGAGGSLRGGTLPIAQMIKKEFGICSLAHFTCRDHSPDEIENILIDHHYFGVNNILALRGDPPDGAEDYFQKTDNRYEFAYHLIDQIKKLNQGAYRPRKGQEAPDAPKQGVPTNFCIGCAAHPEEVHGLEKAVEFLRLKVEHGAQFAITQMLFSAEPYKIFVDACRKAGINIPILPGVRMVAQKNTADYMIKNFGSNIPKAYLDKLAAVTSKEEGKKLAMDFTSNLCQDLLDAGAPGLHVYVMFDSKSGAELLRRFKN